MLKAIFVILLIAPIAALAERNVHFTGDFESGKIMQRDKATNGFFIHTLKSPQVASESYASQDGGFGPESGMDTRVVSSEIVGTEIVRPRAGKYFVRSALYKNKDYSELNNGVNKPRSKIYINGNANKFDFDEEGYLGFSIFLPKNWEHETAIKDDRGSSQLLQVQSQGASWSLMGLRVYVPKGKTEAHWFLYQKFSDTSIKDGERREYDLGSVSNDLGKWTDFVLRYRFNPFSVTTNASKVGGKDRIYSGNKGILQLWKAQGPVDSEGNRPMYLTSVNFENKPVGMVPHPTEKIDWHFRIYKYGWHTRPSDVEGPVWVGFDEIRDGRVAKHGTSYADVHPTRAYCIDKCPNETALPAPPSSIVITR